MLDLDYVRVVKGEHKERRGYVVKEIKGCGPSMYKVQLQKECTFDKPPKPIMVWAYHLEAV